MYTMSRIFVEFQGMMAVHYCALHGRVDVVELLLEYDQEGLIKEQLSLKNKVTYSYKKMRIFISIIT